MMLLFFVVVVDDDVVVLGRCCCCHDDVVVLCYCCCCNDDVVVLCCYDVPIYHFSKENISPLMGIKLGLVHWSNCLDLWVIYLPILCYH